MELTTGAILRRIVETEVSTSAHKLATIILDGIAWQDGYNGLERGTAAFTLAELASKTGVSRQYLSELLSELEASPLRLVRWKPNGKFAPWLFRFCAVDKPAPDPNDVSAKSDTSLSRDSKNKMMFAGKIEIGAVSNVLRTPWGDLIKAAKAALPCWNVDTQAIWDAFRAFNRARGNDEVPAGYLLGFMRKWRTVPRETQKVANKPLPEAAPVPPNITEAQVLARPAPARNRHFHRMDLERLIGRVAYEFRVAAMMDCLGLSWFAASLAVHGQAVLAGEISS